MGFDQIPVKKKITTSFLWGRNLVLPNFLRKIKSLFAQLEFVKMPEGNTACAKRLAFPLPLHNLTHCT